MPPEPVTFRFSRGGVAMIAGGAALVAGLIFAAGYIVGRQTAVPGSRLPVAAPPSAKPVAAPPPPPSTVNRQPSTPVALRLGVYTTPEEAKAAVDELAAREVATKVVEVPTSGGTMLYTVRTAPYPSRAQAAAVATELEKKLGRSVAVVPVD